MKYLFNKMKHNKYACWTAGAAGIALWVLSLFYVYAQAVLSAVGAYFLIEWVCTVIARGVKLHSAQAGEVLEARTGASSSD